MEMPRLNLVVLRVADLERAVAFYRALGLTFDKHAHGSGPEHYACESAANVFELYAATQDAPPSVSTRIGFAVADVDRTIDSIANIEGVRIVSPAKDSPWGRRAVVTDPDGHRVELIQQAE